MAVHSSHLETGKAFASTVLADVSNRTTSIAYLLIYGSLPTASQLHVFESEVMHHSVVHADAEQFFRSFRYIFSLSLLREVSRLTAG